MTPIIFFAPGLPKAQPRPRAFARKMGTKFVARVYEAGTAEAWKSEIAAAARPYLPASPINQPLALDLVFVLPRPKSHYRTGANAAQLRADAPLLHTAKPDVDNLFKAVADALKTLGMFADDGLIAQTSIIKLYGFGTRSGCRIELKPADELLAATTTDSLTTL